MNNFNTIYNNVIGMLDDRKYKIDEKYKNISNADLIRNYHKNNAHINFNNSAHVYFFYNKLGVNNIKNFFNEKKEENIDHLIFIIKFKLTSYAKREFLLSCKDFEKEVFFMDDFIINITKHWLVPKHELLSDDKAKLIVQKYGIKIPHIKLNDKVCRYYNGKINNIFKIYRDNELYFRIVTL